MKAANSVLDASAILALLQQEPGAENLTDKVLENAVASSVNLAEVQTKLVAKGLDPDDAWQDATSMLTAIEPFTGEQAKLAGALVRQTKRVGLSLGDRACLALAISLGADVYTTEKLWKNLKLGIRIHLLR